MKDNSKDRLHEVFFYGLYMDPEILKAKGVVPRYPRVAQVHNFVLRIGKKATILREQGKVTHGIVYQLTHAEIHKLYWGAGLTEYATEALTAKIENTEITVLCSVLIDPPDAAESNSEYEQKLNVVMEKLGLLD